MEPSRAAERHRMVSEQIQKRGVRDEEVLEVLRRIARHFFVPLEFEAQAYEDHPLHIGQGQTISQPYMVGLMTELLALCASDRVLEIGTGSGYQTAVLAELAREVVSVERHPDLAVSAAERLKALGYANVTVLSGDGTLGCAEKAPYDAILVTAGAPAIPEALKEQLAESGRLVCPVGGRDIQELIKLERIGGLFRQSCSIQCVFVPLIGAQGWNI